jgi:hypothetical protein
MTKNLSFELARSDEYAADCGVCGNPTWSGGFLAVAVDDQTPVMNICAGCMKNSPDIDQKLTDKAASIRGRIEDEVARTRESMEQRARDLESLRGRFGNMPTPTQWENAVADAEMLGDDYWDNIEADSPERDEIINAAIETTNALYKGE